MLRQSSRLADHLQCLLTGFGSSGRFAHALPTRRGRSMLLPSNSRTCAGIAFAALRTAHVDRRALLGVHKVHGSERELGRLLGVKFWEVSPLDADSEAPPKWMNPLQHGYWVKAWALRCELAGRAMTASSSACKRTKSSRLCFHGFADVGQPSADLPPLPRGCGLSAVFRIALRWRKLTNLWPGGASPAPRENARGDRPLNRGADLDVLKEPDETAVQDG